MRILVTNDDGFDAPGLKVLKKIAEELSDDVWVVAPESDRSGAGHSITLNEPLRLREITERSFAVKGMPTDCVIMAVRHLMEDKAPDLVLSGVNRGQNVADDVTYSGTIACAMEGAMMGIPSIALSLSVFQHTLLPHFIWETPATHGAGIVRRAIETGWPDNVVLNINFPDREPNDVKGVKITHQGLRQQHSLNLDERLDSRGIPYYWIGYRREKTTPVEGSDLWAVYNGYVSITPLSLDLTDYESQKKLDAMGLALNESLRKAV